MRNRPNFRLIITLVMGCAGLLPGAVAGALAQSPAVLDRVVAVVNNHAILASDVDADMRLSVLDPDRPNRGRLTRRRDLQLLISRTLIQQQIRQQDVQAVEPTDEEVASRVAEIRKNLPACVRENCTTDEGWKTFLAANGLTPQRVESYLRYRMEILRFIEMRFRQGISIPEQDIETYYRDTLLPQYPPGEAKPPLSEVAPRIEEILLQKQVNVLFSDWLDNLRKQGDVEVLDPSLETPDSNDPGGTGSQ